MHAFHRHGRTGLWLAMLCALPLPALPQAGAGAATPAAERRFDLAAVASPMTPRSQSQLLTAMAQAGDRLVAAGARGTVIYSDDAGATWRQADVPVAVMLTGLCFPTPERGWAVGHDGVVLSSADGGATWARQFDGDAGNRQVLAFARQRVERLSRQVESAGGAKRLEAEKALETAEDALAGVESAAKFGPSRPLLGVWFRDAKQGYAVGAFGMAFATRDGGSTWRLIADRLPNDRDLHLYAVASPAPGVILIAGEEGRIYRSTDDGETWQGLPSLTKGSLYGLEVVDRAGQKRVIAFGFGGKVFRSDDLGASWVPVASGADSALFGGAVRPGGQVLLVGNNGIAVRSVDGGETFRASQAKGGRPLMAAAFAKGGWIAAGWGGVTPLAVGQ